MDPKERKELAEMVLAARKKYDKFSKNHSLEGLFTRCKCSIYTIEYLLKDENFPVHLQAVESCTRLIVEGVIDE